MKSATKLQNGHQCEGKVLTSRKVAISACVWLGVSHLHRDFAQTCCSCKPLVALSIRVVHRPEKTVYRFVLNLYFGKIDKPVGSRFYWPVPNSIRDRPLFPTPTAAFDPHSPRPGGSNAAGIRQQSHSDYSTCLVHVSRGCVSRSNSRGSYSGASPHCRESAYRSHSQRWDEQGM